MPHIIFPPKKIQRKIYSSSDFSYERVNAAFNLPKNNSQKLILSPFVNIYERSGKLLFYNRLTNKKAVLLDNAASVKQYFSRNKVLKRGYLLTALCSSDNNILSKLIRGGFFIPIEFDKNYQLRLIQSSRYFSQNHLRQLTIIPTYKCDLKCGYCVSEKIKNTAKFKNTDNCFINLNSLKNTLALVQKILPGNRNEISITFLGGEPLLNWDKFYNCLLLVDEFKKQLGGKQVKTILVTNGLNLTEEKIKILNKYKINISFSLDGLKKHHDTYRKNNSVGSWDKVVRSIGVLKKQGANFSISCAIGPHNYLELEDITRFFIYNLEAKAVCFNLIKGIKSKKDNYSLEKAIDNMFCSFKLLRRAGIYEHRVMSMLAPFVEEEPRFHECLSFGGQIALAPNGYLGACPYSARLNQNIYGHIEDKDIADKIFNSKEYYSRLKRTPYFMNKCLSCRALGICGGGCVHEQLAEGKNIYSLDKDFCLLAKKTINFIVNELISQYI